MILAYYIIIHQHCLYCTPSACNKCVSQIQSIAADYNPGYLLSFTSVTGLFLTTKTHRAHQNSSCCILERLEHSRAILKKAQVNTRMGKMCLVCHNQPVRHFLWPSR